jgi:WD40 repeat protein
VNYVAFSPDGRQIISADKHGTIRTWNFSSPEEVAKMKHINEPKESEYTDY